MEIESYVVNLESHTDRSGTADSLQDPVKFVFNVLLEESLENDANFLFLWQPESANAVAILMFPQAPSLTALAFTKYLLTFRAHDQCAVPSLPRACLRNSSKLGTSILILCCIAEVSQVLRISIIQIKLLKFWDSRRHP